MRFVYTGPSWAASSYPVDSESTSLAKEWGLEHIDYSKPSSTVLDCAKRVKSVAKFPVVWIYNEPLLCLAEATGLSKEEFIKRSDWKNVWEECNQYCLDTISKLDRPVLLIGGHSDIVNCNHPNITVGHSSWQKFLAQHAGMPIKNDTVYVKLKDGSNFNLKHCWGGEVIHRCMHEHPEINPSPEITDAVWDVFFFWKELEQANLFYEVHPNLQGNQLFAKFLKPTVEKFLEDNK